MRCLGRRLLFTNSTKDTLTAFTNIEFGICEMFSLDFGEKLSAIKWAFNIRQQLSYGYTNLQKLYVLEVKEKNKSSVHPTNSPLFSDANEGCRLHVNIDTEQSKYQEVANSLIQPCSSVSNGVAGQGHRAEASGQQQAETSSMQPCSCDSDGEAGVEPRIETFEFPDDLTSDVELQQPEPR
ncbi:hypothetical protein TNIN_107911 [Trichonephila inaurata madagascariensis]|uniref:Uncharacterized protein n=1 Tax=Trichonephila inaurata madagascariensis TaxID=2747483 RepID=A0A8X7CHF3_9ARAC|nr:hypothetical protein TNIN_107911 [Trichonephila inaurata madagascariensis]